MFEQSQLARAEARRPLSFAVSLASQALVLGVVAVATVIHVQDLPAGDWTRVLIAPSPPPAAPSPPPASEPVRSAAPERFEAELRQPIEIPDRVAVLVEEKPAAPAAPATGVVGSVPGGLPDGVIGSIAGGAAPPPPPPEPEPKPEPAAPEPDAGPIRVSEGVQAAKLVRRATPIYPQPAVRARVQGTVRLQAIIAEDGSIARLEVLSGHPFLVQEAVRAVSQWRYRPTLLSGRPTAVATQIEVHFRLD